MEQGLLKSPANSDSWMYSFERELQPTVFPIRKGQRDNTIVPSH